MSIQRPLSPHMQVYRLFSSITSLTSILHRATGAALVFGSLLIVWWLMAIAHGEAAYNNFTQYAHMPLGQLVLIGFTWAFWYQLLNGVRHLAWDAGFGFKLPTAKTTGILVILSSVIATAVTWIYICGAL
jgi:succinate dehydrogenase / fumarate reductase, cytochrome b subunit